MGAELSLTPVPAGGPAKLGNRRLRPFGVLRESPAFHFYLLQAVGFLYLAWRFASRNYTVFGVLPPDAFDYPRGHVFELLPIPSVWFVTGQFIYEFIPRPGPDTIAAIQAFVVAVALLGFAGIRPRVCAVIGFFAGTHFTGMVQATGADMDGGSLLYCLLLILALSPGSNFYGRKHGFRPGRLSVDHHWPSLLVLVTVSAYYTFSGVMKVVDSGPLWPIDVHLDHLALSGREESLFKARPFRLPVMAWPHVHFAVSVIDGLASLFGELFFFGVLLWPRWRMRLVVTMILLHHFVLFLNGINFTGNSFLIAMCLDWNALARRITVLYDGECGFCRRATAWLGRADLFKRLDFRPIEELPAAEAPFDPAILEREMGAVDQNGDAFHGADAFEELGARVPFLWPFALAMKFPGAMLVARPVYRLIAKHRKHMGCRIDGACSL